MTADLGIGTRDLGYFDVDTPLERRREAERELRAALDAGIACSLLNYDHQLITGYDDTGFVVVNPWPQHDEDATTHITFETWDELGDQFHMSFYVHERTPAAEPLEAIRQSLEFAVAQRRADGNMGLNAYRNWLKAIDNDHGGSHGNWWNAIVWGECRRFAASYLQAVADLYPEVGRDATRGAEIYETMAGDFVKASDREMSADAKSQLVRSLWEREETALECVSAVLEALEQR